VELSGPLQPARVARILDQVTGALAEAHGLGLIHRDIKPSNIMMVEQGGVPDVAKVLDFGLVKELSRSETEADDALAVSHVNVVTGTPQFLSPEAIRSPELVDARSDLYALGAVAYFLLTGEQVFSGTTVLQVCSDHLHTVPIAPSERCGKSVPAGLEQLVLDCLAKEQEQRPQSALELQERVRGLQLAEEWTDEDAQLWWKQHGRAVAACVEGRAEDVSNRRIEVDILGRAAPPG